MSLVVSYDGKRAVASLVQAYLGGLTLHLFANDYTPTAASLALDFSEPSFSGYGAVPLKYWSNVYLALNGNAETDAPAIYFVVGPGGGTDTVYGYFVLDQFGYLIFSERRPAGGFPMMSPGTVFPVVPRFQVGPLC